MSDSQDSKTPRYLELANQLRRRVNAGDLKPGDKLPTFASMKAEHGLSQNTWDRAYALLEKEQLVVRWPNRGTFVAQQPSRNWNGVIGVSMDSAPWDHPYYTQLMKGIHKAAHQARAEVLLLSEVAGVDWEKMGGLLVVGGDNLTEKLPPHLPCVSLLRNLKGIDSILTDDYHGMREAVEHLLSLGHQRIGYLATGILNSRHAPSNQRFIAYQDTLRSAGIAADPRWVRLLRGDKAQFRNFTEMGRKRMGIWLRAGWGELGCTALLVQNDDAAIGVIEALNQVGFRVPEQVSVVGFDGTEIAQYYRPRLTTVKVPLEAIGMEAVKKLLEKINVSPSSSLEKETPGGVSILPARLMMGESTAPSTT